MTSVSCRVLRALTIIASVLGSVSDSAAESVTLNEKDDGYRGVWYMNQPSGDEYVYKYSGGLGTYCAKHRPFAVYRQEVDRTFFCYGGTTHDSNRQLLHMVSFYDHETGTVPRPTILLNKQTNDAHDNPVITIDTEGYIWIFSTSHGQTRPSYIHRSKRPYDIEQFELVPAVMSQLAGDEAITNFSYMQAWHTEERGFLCFFTRYSDPAARTLFFMASGDGKRWSERQRLAAIEAGHYQVSAVGQRRAGSAFNYHPRKGVNWRTNLYYMETRDGGKSWCTVDGVPLEIPLTEIHNPARICDYQTKGLNVYLKDILYDAEDRPVILYVTSRGYEAGPTNDPRTWTTVRWTGSTWEIHDVLTSDNNYDTGSLWIDGQGVWNIMGPTETGPQPYNPGGEVAWWSSNDRGATWAKRQQLTRDSERNHTYVRRPENAHPGFVALWADGHGRKPSPSSLYFADARGRVYQLPRKMESDRVVPKRVE